MPIKKEVANDDDHDNDSDDDDDDDDDDDEKNKAVEYRLSVIDNYRLMPEKLSYLRNSRHGM